MCGICFKLWKLLFFSYWLNPGLFTNLGFGANFQIKEHWEVEGFSISITGTPTWWWAAAECALHAGKDLRLVANWNFVPLFPSRCSECQDPLTNWYYEKDGKLYCHKDYWGKFGESCHGCSLLMTGPVMVRSLKDSCLGAGHACLYLLKLSWELS